jgi:hypothetical protein
LELDPMLSEGHTALVEISVREYRWNQAERFFRRALELNPHNAVLIFSSAPICWFLSAGSTKESAKFDVH